MAQGTEELRREAAVMTGKHNDKYKTRLCTGFTFKHRCTKGARCEDAHGAADLRWVLRACMSFVMLYAAWGCNIAHGRWDWPCLSMGQPVCGQGQWQCKAVQPPTNASLAFATALYNGSLQHRT